MKQPFSIAIYSGVSKSSTFIERLITGLADEDIDVYIFGSDNGKPQKSNNVFYKVYRGKLQKLLYLIKYTLLLYVFKYSEKKRLDNYIKTQLGVSHKLKLKYYPVLYHKPQIFHLQWAKGIADWIWVEDFGIRLVLSLRGAHINYSPIVDESLSKTYKELFPMVSSFHAVSDAIAKEAIKYNAEPENIEAVKSGLRLTDFPFTSKKFDSKEPLKLISVGRDHWVKNYKLALDTIYALKSQGFNVYLKIIGVANSEALLFQRNQLGLNENVSFIGTMPFEYVRDAIKEADIMLLTSIKEGIANVVLEAMALGTLVVSTDCGGMSEVIKDKHTGFLASQQNVQAVADTILKVLELNSDQYIQITRQARAFVEEHHTEKEMVVKMKNLYQSIIPKRI